MADPIVHGGNLHEASQRYGIPYAQWLDLSTGINPHGYPVPPVPADAWRRLPDEGDGLAACAAHYYGAPDARHVLPVAGSQAAIRALPQLLPRATVAIAPLSYSEYAPAFERAGHRIVPLDIACDALPDDVTHAVVVNPNNPTADHLSTAKLLQWHAQLAARGGVACRLRGPTRSRRTAFARQVFWPRWRARRFRAERRCPAGQIARGTWRVDRQRSRETCSNCSLHGSRVAKPDARATRGAKRALERFVASTTFFTTQHTALCVDRRPACRRAASRARVARYLDAVVSRVCKCAVRLARHGAGVVAFRARVERKRSRH